MDLVHMFPKTPPPIPPIVEYVFYSTNYGIYHERRGEILNGGHSKRDIGLCQKPTQSI